MYTIFTKCMVFVCMYRAYGAVFVFFSLTLLVHVSVCVCTQVCKLRETDFCIHFHLFRLFSSQLCWPMHQKSSTNSNKILDILSYLHTRIPFSFSFVVSFKSIMLFCCLPVFALLSANNEKILT